MTWDKEWQGLILLLCRTLQNTLLDMPRIISHEARLVVTGDVQHFGYSWTEFKWRGGWTAGGWMNV